MKEPLESPMTATTHAPMPHAHAAAHGRLPASLTLLLAASAGFSVATLYLAQPILGALGGALGAGDGTIGLVPTLTQLGYALGLALLAPLGDRYDRRRLIVLKAAVLAVALAAAGLAQGIGVLLIASLVIGLSATLAQDVVPAAATLAPDAHRGKVVGTVMTGLLLGILMSRVASGFVAEHYGWRSVFFAASAILVLVGLAAQRGLPSLKPTTRLPYGELLASLVGLWRRHPTLRRAAVAQGLLAVAFSAFWSTLALLLHGAPYHLGSAVVGAFGIAGAAGALIAPVAGRLADRVGPARVAAGGAAVVLATFAAMAALHGGGTTQVLWVLGASAVVFDLGFQGALIAHQTLVYGIDPGARSRLNAVLFVGMFTGMASGAGLGSLLFAQAGWYGVLGLAITAAAAALVVRLRR